MPSYNKVILLGNLTRDPEIRYTPNGTAVASFTLAVNKKYRAKGSDEVKEEVSFIDCVAFAKQAENIAQYQNKGDSTLVEGEIQQRRWEDKETGQKRSKIEVAVRMVQFMPRTGKNGQPGSPSEDNRGDAPPVDEGEIPF
jgi:single-strand DNA-binding protein